MCKGSPCDCLCLHNMTFSDAGGAVWKCQNCGKETPRRYRKSKKKRELDQLFTKLSKGEL